MHSLLRTSPGARRARRRPPRPRARAVRAVVRPGAAERIVEMVEKPTGVALAASCQCHAEGLRAPAEWLRQRGAAPGRDLLANMGIYVFAKQVLLDLLRDSPSAHDLVHGLLL